MILSTVGISKSFGEELIIDDASILINEGEKVALVGINGSGKTTFLRIIASEIKADSGDVIFAKSASFAYLKQINDIDSDLSIEEELVKVIQPILDTQERFGRLQEEIALADEEEISIFAKAFSFFDGQVKVAGFTGPWLYT